MIHLESIDYTIIKKILSGDIAIASDFDDEIYIIKSFTDTKRNVTIPPVENVTKGPREGFNETLRDNLALIRKRIVTPDFKTEKFILGNKSNTTVVLMFFLEHVAPPEAYKTCA